MNLKDFRARMRRLEDLSAGLAKEASLWPKCDARGYAGEGESSIGSEAGAIGQDALVLRFRILLDIPQNRIDDLGAA